MYSTRGQHVLLHITVLSLQHSRPAGAGRLSCHIFLLLLLLMLLLPPLLLPPPPLVLPPPQKYSWLMPGVAPAEPQKLIHGFFFVQV